MGWFGRFGMLQLAVLLVLTGAESQPALRAQYLEEETVRAAAAVLSETMATPMSQIPQSMLQNAHGVAIIPNVLKGSFVVGARHGRGLLFVREAGGSWHAPVFIRLTGGNIGWQVGVQSSDIILVFKTPKSVQGILSGKLTLGADAAAAAGPIGRQGAVATDGRLQAEIYSYSRSRGLFAGVSIDGSVLQVDSIATGAYYRAPAPGQSVIVPDSARQLTQSIAALTGSTPLAAPGSIPGQEAAGIAQELSATESDILRHQLLQLSPRLFDLLDAQWQSYLALPAELLNSQLHPSAASLSATLGRYDQIAKDPRYQTLAARPEFQSVHGLLRHYAKSLQPTPSDLQLPPPPQ